MKGLPIFFLILVAACSHINKPQQVNTKRTFQLAQGERSFFDTQVYDDSFIIDSSSTLSALDSFRRNCADNHNKCCISFLFKADSGRGDLRINIAVNYPGKSRAGAPDGRKFLWISLFPDGEVDGYSGGYVSSTKADRENADSAVFVFLNRAYGLETAEEKKRPGYEPVHLIVICSSENIGYLDERIAEIVKGYIYYLGGQAKFLFNKPVDSLSLEQKGALLSAYPLSVSVGRHN